jgi:hypothetical protein
MEKIGMRFEKDANYFDIDVVQYVIQRREYKGDASPYILRQTPEPMWPGDLCDDE